MSSSHFVKMEHAFTEVWSFTVSLISDHSYTARATSLCLGSLPLLREWLVLTGILQRLRPHPIITKSPP